MCVCIGLNLIEKRVGFVYKGQENDGLGEGRMFGGGERKKGNRKG